LFICVFPASLTGFVITSWQKSLCLYTKTTASTTTIWEERKNGNYDNIDLLNATSTSSTSTTNDEDEEDVVSKNTKCILESLSPKDMIVESDEETKEENFEDQIFNPMSFWTERTGRFPRNQ
jgi:hypothetical protein